jgi:hypothetical protein
VIGQMAEMFPSSEPAPADPPPEASSAPPPVKKVARLDVAKDVLAAIGLVSGIAIAVISLWAILKKYRPPSAPPSNPG